MQGNFEKIDAIFQGCLHSQYLEIDSPQSISDQEIDFSVPHITRNVLSAYMDYDVAIALFG